MPSPENLAGRAAAERLAAILDSSDDAIFDTNLDGVIAHWNRGAEQIFGYTAEEIIGTSVTRLIPRERPGEENLILERIGRGEKVERMVTRRLARDGRLLHVSITAVPLRDGTGEVAGVSAIVRDLTPVREREREFTRQSRLSAALSQISQAIVTMPTRDELFAKVCQALVLHGRLKLAWIAWHDPADDRLVPVAHAASAPDGFQDLLTQPGDERPGGPDPSATAFRENRSGVCNDLLADPVPPAQRAGFQRRGLRASAVLPIRGHDVVNGTLNVYADEPGFFHAREISLLEEAARDLAFGLDNLARRDERHQAEQKVRQERDVSDAMLHSLPGVFYLYDREGRFLRWNRNFEVVTGYSAEELAVRHPLDFFAGEDRDRVAARIDEVFARGESNLEAGLVTKDGRVLPYYFTGVATGYEGRPCLVGVGIDLTARKQAEAALHESEERLRATVERPVADAGPSRAH